MHELVKTFICSQDTAILATAQENRPYCSFMSYVADDTCTSLFLITSTSSRKYANALRNPEVSLLIDSRKDAPDRESVQALTITGTCAPVHDEARKAEAMERLLALNPGLKAIAEQGDADVLEVEIETVLLLSGPVDAFFERIR
jgi:nitroimidazol reductase NimA-like FMN-containing flavoprotein (pyridoxamine 5'-phosphate oxidase superfamily)